ncbi:MAG TPA: alpha/beta hydrolase [Dysgonamonadaceae bacterium]|jgi:acetyl esterase/lipase|nr:alpha/beta hydrolase [Dysgonamonadaceae bacterium]
MKKQEPIVLFPNGAPREIGEMIESKSLAGRKVSGRSVLRIRDVSQPTITFYPAPEENNSRTTIIVIPGGRYEVLSFDLEGTEICKRFNESGINCILLKYRVPRRKKLSKHAAPLQDLQRAIAYTRAHADNWNLDKSKIGVIGFSAGGHLAVMASNSFSELTYTAIDNCDKENIRPDFCILIYPSYLDRKNFSIAPEINVTDKTPQTFLVQTQDDHKLLNSSLFYYYALKESKVPAAMHLYQTGGHAYGLRETGNLVSEWPNRVLDWLSEIGILEN